MAKMFAVALALLFSDASAQQPSAFSGAAAHLESAAAKHGAIRAGAADDWTTLKVRVTADDNYNFGYFGHAVAIDGDTIVVGAYKDDDKGSDSGSAYVFVKGDGVGSWSQDAKLTAADSAKLDYFGFSVGISGDYIVVGADSDDDKGPNAGAAYVFVKGEGVASWNEKAKLTAADGAKYDSFGYSVGISGDYIVVGAPGDDDKGSSAGAAYVFVKGEGVASWNEKAKLTAADGAKLDFFGFSVGISGDYIVVGAHAYVFVKGDGDASWKEAAKLTAYDGAKKDYFGRSMAIGGDKVIVGAQCNDDAGSFSGSESAYVFVKGADGAWAHEANLLAEDGAANDKSGVLVALLADGLTAVVGTETGSAFFYNFPPQSTNDPTPQPTNDSDPTPQPTNDPTPTPSHAPTPMPTYDSPDTVELGLAGNFAILAKAGVTNVPQSHITGDVGVSPIAGTARTGFALMQHHTTHYATSDQVDGKLFAADDGGGTPAMLTTAISDMEGAYTDAAGRPNTDASRINLAGGLIGGETLTPGVYTWGSNISGNAIFADGVTVTLDDDAKAENIIWQVAGNVKVGDGAHLEGIFLVKMDAAFKELAPLNGRVLAQTAVTLISNTINQPTATTAQPEHRLLRGAK
ncbi:FG-GAP repeat-domain-containing protein [Pelagophyceae sp. CCMP2097]|nr:FG-GAP repeat-domain-containing protein [Pelagophyceae sp. CCMP2097]